MNQIILERLGQADPLMKKLIDIIGPLPLVRRDDCYQALLRSIVGQQLSAKVASVINERLKNLANHNLSPSNILSLSDENLREIGISFRKISYIRDLSEKVEQNEIIFDHLFHMGNETVIQILTEIKGIGRWTAEMFLIFSLGRLDVLSLLDIGLQRGGKWLYSASKDTDGKKLLEEKGKHWAPYQSIASLYLWEIVNLGFVVEYTSFNNYLNRS
ncbi:DNA-3-methyladenine glycosylase 2 family protein [Bacillus sp. FJAT-49736]|uniref:DNA-3-methyladenine glycosylase family protein n=1 Tax=Bacillus sp. FJAT-49736 TaxID=2833582 RepID=UPI001BCA3AC1|nr:DNA-3-methyladenine glycosylase 2 family protein [Bacillus sp. FJAT-49736]MBS4172797.1 DNA-3-methyladenine glycosylase 2 family protein [Bacillus sp. FJAT-49736]